MTRGKKVFTDWAGSDIWFYDPHADVRDIMLALSDTDGFVGTWKLAEYMRDKAVTGKGVASRYADRVELALEWDCTNDMYEVY